MSNRTANEIITMALKRVGNETIADTAQAEFQAILDRLYEDIKWPFTRLSVTGTVSGRTITLPSNFVDFWDEFSLTLYDSSSNMARVRIIPIQQFELLNSANSLGTPTVAYHDVENGTVIFDTTPNTTLTYRLIYRYMPAEISDFDAVVVFPNDSILIQAIYCWALQYEDDDRYAAELTVLDNMISRYRRRFGISPDVNSKMAYNPATFNNIGNFR